MYFHACKHIRYPNRNDTFLGKTKANAKIRSPFEDMSRSQGLSGPSFQRQAVSPPNGVHAFGGGILPSCFLSQKSTLFNSQRRIASFECRSSGSCVCTVFCLVFWLFDFWFGLWLISGRSVRSAWWVVGRVRRGADALLFLHKFEWNVCARIGGYGMCIAARVAGHNVDRYIFWRHISLERVSNVWLIYILTNRFLVRMRVNKLCGWRNVRCTDFL